MLSLRRAWSMRAFYLFVLPAVLYYVVYRYLPLLGNVVGFKDYLARRGILGSPWANPWYKHFVYFFASPYFTQLITNTLFLSLAKLLLGVAAAVTLALLLNEVRNKGYKQAIQTLTYLPHFLSWVIVYGMAQALLSQTNGLVNLLWRGLFGTTIPFFTSPGIFRGLLVASELWKDMGWSAIIYLAAIAGIDPSLYESAAIDGASRWQRMWRITLPSIRGIVVIMLILGCGQIMNAGFDQVYIMYNPQVYSTADIIDTWVFRTGIEQFDIGLASAVGLFKSAIGLLLVLLVNRLARQFGEALW